MPTNHTAQPGDCVSSLARQSGFGDPQTVYGDGANAALRARRPNLNVLSPGDVVVIPDRLVRKAPCDTTQRHTFRLSRKPTLLRVVLRDDDGPLAGVAYHLAVVGGEGFDGSTDGAGKIEHPIAADTARATLTFWLTAADRSHDGYVIPIELGHLRPEDDVEGCQQRLINLAFDCGVTGAVDAATQEALKGFQRSQSLPATGALDATTRTRLRQAHEGA